MKKLLFIIPLLFGCSVENKLPTCDEVYYQQPISKIENMQWSDLYVTKDSVYHRYLYTEKDGDKILILEISY